MTNNDIGWLELFLSFHGRIGRRQYWIGLLLMFVIVIGVGLVGALLPHSIEIGFTIVLFLFAAIASVAIAVKRLHDRNRTGWWIAAPVLIYLALDVAELSGWSNRFRTAETFVAGLGGAAFVLAYALSAILFIFNLWLFIELGFLRGTTGPNRFGDDPLRHDGPLPSAPSPDTHPA